MKTPFDITSWKVGGRCGIRTHSAPVDYWSARADERMREWVTTPNKAAIQSAPSTRPSVRWRVSRCRRRGQLPAIARFLCARRNGSPTAGISSIPEFSVSSISCLTIMAQFRVGASTPKSFGSRVACRDAMAIPDRRNKEAKSLLYLMNMALMTIRSSSSSCAPTPRVVLLPQAIASSSRDIPISWSKYALLLGVCSSELSWQDLLHCGGCRVRMHLQAGSH